MSKVKEMNPSQGMQENVEEPQLSKEELAERRQEVTSFYKDNIKHLKVQLDYEEYLTKIEKTRAERLQAQMFMAQAYAAQEAGPQGSDQPKQAQVDFEAMQKSDAKRTLKRD